MEIKEVPSYANLYRRKQKYREEIPLKMPTRSRTHSREPPRAKPVSFKALEHFSPLRLPSSSKAEKWNEESECESICPPLSAVRVSKA